MKSRKYVNRQERKPLLLALLTLCAAAAFSQTPGGMLSPWTPVGPQNATVFALEPDPFDSNVYWAGTYFGGLYRTLDSGQHWVHIPSPFSTYSVFTIAVHPRTRGRIYVGTFQGGVYLSDDGGRNWAPRNHGLTNLNVQHLALDPANHDHLLVTTNAGVFYTVDAGATWKPSESGDILYPRSVAFDAMNPGVVWLGTTGSGVFRSEDGGRTWAGLSAGLRNPVVVDLKSSPVSGALYAAVSNGVYRLSRGGSSWVDLTEDLPKDINGVHLALDSAAQRIYYSTDKGVFVRREDDVQSGWTVWTQQPSRLLLLQRGYALLSRYGGGLRASADGGRSWVTRENGVQNLFVGAMAVTASGGQSRVLAGGDSGVFISDTLANWTKAPNFGEGVFRFLVPARTPNVVLAGTERAGVWRSINAGEDWKASADGIVPPGFFGLSYSAEPGVIYAATTSGLYITRNNGERWGQDQVTGTLGTAFSVCADPVERNRVVFGGDGGKVFESLDLGRTFTLKKDGLPPEIVRFVKVIAFGPTYAITSGGGLFVLDGHRWLPLWLTPAKGALAVDADPKKPWILYMATQDGMYKSASGGIEWERISNGIESPPQIYSVVVDQAQEGVVYAAGTSQVYKSTDEGATWTPYKEGLPPNAAVTSLSIDPADHSVLIATLQDNGVYRSKDGGRTWNRLSDRLPEKGVPVVAMDPRGSGTTLVGTYLEGLYVSRQGREFVRDAPGLTLFVRGLASDPAGQRVYAGALLGGLFRSDDAAVTWRNKGLLDRNIFDVQIHPANPDVVYAGTGMGVSRSADGGETWADLIPRVAYITAMAVDGRNRNIVYTGSLAGRLNRSSDGGATWQEAGRGLPYLTILSLAVDPRDGTVYASLDHGGIYRSRNGGLDWTKASDLLVGSDYTAQLLAVSPQSGAVYAGSRGAGVFVSPDAGGFWASINGDLRSYEVSDLVIDAGDAVYAATLNAGVFRTTDTGKTWIPVSQGLPQQPVIALAADPSKPGRVYAGTGSGVYVTDDGGAEWKPLPDGLGGAIVVSVALASPDVLYVTVEGVGVLKSADGGATWKTVNDKVSAGARYLLPGASADQMYIGSQGLGLLRSTDGGSTWQGAIEPTLVEPAVLALRVHPADPSRLYAGTAGAGVLVSRDAGATWSPANSGLSAKQILSLAVDPGNPDIVYAGTVEAGVYMSVDGGSHWTPLNTGLFNLTVTSLAVDPADPRMVYAGTEGGGVFRAQVRP